MAFSSGTFSLVAGNPVVTGTTISSTWANDTLSDIATNGLTNCMLKDGTQTVTANIPFSGFRLTNLGNATALTDAARCSQVQNGAYNVATSVAGTNTITASLTPALTGYTEGLLVMLRPLNTNTGQATLNLNSVGAVPIFMNGSTATTSQLRSGNQILFQYVSTSSSTGFHVVGNSGFLPRETANNWTPSLTFGGGSTGMTYGTQVGRVVTLGPLVIAQFRIVLTAKGSSTGTAVLNGLPFTSANVSGLVGSNAFGGTALSSIVGNLSAIVSVNGTTASLEFSGTGTVTAMTEAHFTDTSDISGTLVYLRAE